jgi:hypothetical protein
MATLLLGMALGGAIVLAFIAILACAAVKRTRRQSMSNTLPVTPVNNADDAMEAQLPYGTLSIEDTRRGSVVLAPESLREKMLAGL